MTGFAQARPDGGCDIGQLVGRRWLAAVRVQRAAQHFDGVAIGLVPLREPLILEFLVELEPVLVWLALPALAHVRQRSAPGPVVRIIRRGRAISVRAIPRRERAGTQRGDQRDASGG